MPSGYNFLNFDTSFKIYLKYYTYFLSLAIRKFEVKSNFDVCLDIFKNLDKHADCVMTYHNHIKKYLR